VAERPGVLVTSAQERFGLAACRSLAGAGYRVGAVADQTPAAAHWSRCCSERHVLVDAKADPDAFVDGLAAIAARTPYAVLLPATDAALLAVSGRRDRLAGMALGLPPHEAVEAATDKVELDRAAREAGLASPDTAVCRTPEDGLRAARELGLPLVVKPRRTAFEVDGAFQQRGGAFLATEADVADAAGRFGSPSSPAASGRPPA
jgi:predicted ATP-grasp superfamily ATP-dependent carboligase